MLLVGDSPIAEAIITVSGVAGDRLVIEEMKFLAAQSITCLRASTPNGVNASAIVFIASNWAIGSLF
jgi:hypothetical protein